MKFVTPQAIVRLQDALVRLLGSSVEGRAELVAGMLRRNAAETTSYWLQLGVSIGIATLGLVVGSAAVVIGAMLVAPLMGPILGLAMGLASGSPFLVLRSAARIGISVVVAVGGAALITLALPFHELNGEIAARTSPTILDLATASFCALAGVYASLRPGSDTATTAAGTSIGISLVPPLCASGYGLGTVTWPVAGGAGLLFLTNMVAIVVIGTVFFVIAGFNRVDVVALEQAELGVAERSGSFARPVVSRLSRVFASRWGTTLRILMPFLFLGALFVPLRQALDEVAWQVRVRAAVRAAIARERAPVVQSRIRVEHHEVEVGMVILGNAHASSSAKTRLDAEIRQASGVVPRIEILAVPDANAVAGLVSTVLSPRAPVAPPVVAPPTADEQLSAARARIRTVVKDLWPSGIAGEPLVIDLGTGEEDPLRIRVVHLGAPLSVDGAETLRRAIAVALDHDPLLVDVAVPTGELTRQGGDLALVSSVAAGVRATAGVPGTTVCVVRPEPPRGRRRNLADDELARVLEQTLALHPRVTSKNGAGWSVRFAHGPCEKPPGQDQGVPQPVDSK